MSENFNEKFYGISEASEIPAAESEGAEEELFDITNEGENDDEKNEADLLVEWRDALKEKVTEYINSGRFFSDSKVMERCDESDILPRFQEMIERVFDETPALKELDDTIGKDNILRSFADAEFPTSVLFGSEDELKQEEARLRGGKTQGAILGDYNNETEQIRIKDEIPNPKNVWSELSWAEMPTAMKTLDHELVHHWYNKKRKQELADDIVIQTLRVFESMAQEKLYTSALSLARYAYSLAKKLPPGLISWEMRKLILNYNAKLRTQLQELYLKSHEKRLFSEVVAQKAGRIHDKSANTTTSLLDTLISTYGYRDSRDIDRIIVASQSIDRLRALRLSDREIAEIFAGAEYDSKTISIPVVEKRIEELAAQNGMTAEDLDMEVDLGRVRREGNMYQAARIAQEELAKFADVKRYDIA